MSKAYPIIKTAVRHLGSLVVSSGMDRNDAIQHIALVFVGRLQGPHPFNPSKGSLESYCRMLAKSVLINQKAKRIRRATGDVIFAGMQETT